MKVLEVCLYTYLHIVKHQFKAIEQSCLSYADSAHEHCFAPT